MNKKTIGAIVCLALAFVGMVVYSSIQAQPSDYSGYDAGKIITDTSQSGGIAEHVRGKADSKVVVVEYADFQCPGCASMMPKVDKIYEKYQDEVAFVFRHYPISGHQNARSASSAAESAGMQGYFWEMARALYANQADWAYESGDERTSAFVKVFQDAVPEGNVDRFIQGLSSSDSEKKVNFDQQIGKKISKVEATPSFYVNGKLVELNDDDTLDDFAESIEKAIKEELAK